MLNATERSVLELLLREPRSPTELAAELDVTVQTASRNLTKLVESGFAERTTEGKGRGYKRYRACEFTHVFSGFDGELFEGTLPLSVDKRAVLSVWQVPQPEFHPTLLALLFTPHLDRTDLGVVAIVVFGSVARGTADSDSDVDVLLVYDPDRASRRDVHDVDVNELLDTAYATSGGMVEPDRSHVVTENWYGRSEFEAAVDAGSEFLWTVLDEGIVLLDVEGVIRRAKEGRTGERVSP